MKKTYTDIDVIACVQGNTVRKADLSTGYGTGRDTCVVYDFRREAAASGRESVLDRDRNRDRKQDRNRDKRRRNTSRKRAARVRAGKVRALRTAMFAFLLMVCIFGIGGIASRAKSKEAPSAYKYYDTITVAYQENLLDIVQRYDDRNYYETQNDYLTELCRINNLEYDGTSYPNVTPGTHLVVPYYSTVLK